MKNDRTVIVYGQPLEFKDLAKHERDSIYEHWVGLAKQFYSNPENRARYEEWKNKKQLVA